MQAADFGGRRPNPEGTTAVMDSAETAVAPGEDPREYARLLERVYDATMAGARPPARPRTVVGESWERVRAVGLGPDADPSDRVEESELDRRRRESGLEAVIDDIGAGLAPLIDGGDNILVVADRDGRVLWRHGSARVLGQADRLGFVAGAGWAEHQVGTNAIGTALAARAPVQIFSAEHFVRSHHAWTCAGAPIRDARTGAILGVVDVSGPAAGVHPTTVALVAAVARLAESQLREAHLLGLDRLRRLASPMLARLGRPGVAVDVDGWVVAASDMAPRSRITLPAQVNESTTWLPELGRCLLDPLPGGWLLQPVGARAEESPTTVTLDVRSGRSAEVVVAGDGGTWRHALSPRHAQILEMLAAAPAGRSAAQLAQALFGDPTRVVTVRAEISRLRRVLAGLIEARPYRFADGVVVRLLG
ncbi:GAF domain-containing protein [Jongsikchunia kroppenstedtii]|uniref:GAF domain-containing protein n=1 Tax=Jongsikchunia kroppenstedtii TaxID=1121721 RepID=UPI0003807F97|nr:GAF domain-containing protein [Jongsikchunia kroppenstedtii]